MLSLSNLLPAGARTEILYFSSERAIIHITYTSSALIYDFFVSFLRETTGLIQEA
jgi:hypothetical protein